MLNIPGIAILFGVLGSTCNLLYQFFPCIIDASSRTMFHDQILGLIEGRVKCDNALDGKGPLKGLSNEDSHSFADV